MTIRTRILLVYLLLVGGGLYYLLGSILREVRPRYLESMEESLVDAANLLATAVEQRGLEHGEVSAAAVRSIFDPAYRRELHAPVYTLLKTQIDLRIHVTDTDGVVRYDSDHGRDEGKDFSHWRDVRHTLLGEYGARATREIPDDESSLVIFVAAPIRFDGKIVGVLSVGKPTKNVNELVAVAKRRILWAGLLGGILIVLLGVAFSVWLATPLERLTAYARAVRDGKPATLPRLAGREVGDLKRAFEEMREALEGKQYVERYTQALTHEIKAPLSAIRGAAELLSEKMDPAQQEKFLQNIRDESGRIQHIVDQVLQLSALEARKGLQNVETFSADELIADAWRSLDAAARTRRIRLQAAVSDRIHVRGERFLLSLALTNLFKNAIEFSPDGAVILLTVSPSQNGVTFCVADQGPGIPDYARERIFERFYSLPRPHTKAKSTGLGLSFVQEIAALHAGSVRVANGPRGGCIAEFWVPR